MIPGGAKLPLPKKKEVFWIKQQLDQYIKAGPTTPLKSRGVYETPGGTLLYAAHRAIESVTLDKKTAHDKERVMPEYAELVYNGYWFSKKRIKLQKIIDKNKSKVSGDIILGLYKGNITILSRRTKNKAYSMKKVSFEENKTFNKKKVESFINYHSKQLNKS